MAFTRGWDESVPDGAVEPADQIDENFREFKVDVRERLEDVSTFGTDTDPLNMLEGTARLTVDTNANKPSNPDLEGELYYESDTDKLFVAVDDGGLTWKEVTGSATTSVPIETAVAAYYDDANSPGGKVVEENSFDTVLHLQFTGTTNSSGEVTIDLGELDESLSVADSAVGQQDSLVIVPHTNAVRGALTGADDNNNTITITFTDDSASNLADSSITFSLMMFFNTS